jgi:hypothetical protein
MGIHGDLLPHQPQAVREAAADVVSAAGTYDASEAILIAAGEIIAGLREELAQVRAGGEPTDQYGFHPFN